MEITIQRNECLRCGYKWFSKPTPEGIVIKPKVCSKCKNAWWDTPRRIKKGGTQNDKA